MVRVERAREQTGVDGRDNQVLEVAGAGDVELAHQVLICQVCGVLGQSEERQLLELKLLCGV